MTEEKTTPAPPPAAIVFAFTKDERKDKLAKHIHSKQNTKEAIKELSALKDSSTVKDHFIVVTDKMFAAFESAIDLIEYEMDFAVNVAKKRRDSEATGGNVDGRQWEICNDLLDMIADHINLAFKGMKHLDTNMRSAEVTAHSQYGPKKGLIGKNVERAHDLADKTSRTVTGGLMPLKRRREIKGK